MEDEDELVMDLEVDEEEAEVMEGDVLLLNVEEILHSLVQLTLLMEQLVVINHDLEMEDEEDEEDDLLLHYIDEHLQVHLQ